MYRIYLDTSKRYLNKVTLFKDDKVLDHKEGDFDVVTMIADLLSVTILVFFTAAAGARVVAADLCHAGSYFFHFEPFRCVVLHGYAGIKFSVLVSNRTHSQQTVAFSFNV